MLKIGVIGAGHWGQNHIRVLNNLASLGKCNFIGICDEDKKREALALQYKTHFFDDYMKLADYVDAVIIATPASLLYDIASFFLKKGKHVLVEKPFSKTLKEGKKLNLLSQQKKLILMVGHVFLYTSQILKIEEILNKKILGNISYAYSQRLNLGIIRNDVNALWNFAPHDISIFNHLFKSNPKSVSAWGKAFLQSKVEDVVFLQMEYPSGVWVNCHLSWVDPVKTRKVTIVGSNGMLVWDDTSLDQSIRIYDKKIKIENNSKKGLTFTQFKSIIAQGDEVIPYISPQEPLKNELLHFLECIETGKKPLTDGDHAVDVLKVLEGSQKSLEEKGRIVNI